MNKLIYNEIQHWSNLISDLGLMNPNITPSHFWQETLWLIDYYDYNKAYLHLLYFKRWFNLNLLFILIWSLLDSSIEMEFLVSDKKTNFSHYACEILRATDVACKSYKRKRSESSVTTIITIYEFSLRFHL